MNQVGIPLKHIVESLLIEMGYDSKHKYLPMLHVANDGLRELEWDVSGSTKIEVIEPDNQGVVKLPEDFVKEVRVAAIDSFNNLIPLSRNNDIFKTKDGCGNYSGNNYNSFLTTENTSLWVDTSAEHWSNGQFIGRWYGIGGSSTAGEFKINRNTGEIWLGPLTRGCRLVLEYIGYMPERVGGQFLVHPFLKEPLMNWMHFASRRRLAAPGEVEYLHKKYIDSKNWARQRFWNMDFSEVLDAIRGNFTQTPRT